MLMDNSGKEGINKAAEAQRPTEEDCGQTGQISGVNVDKCVTVKKGGASGVK